MPAPCITIHTEHVGTRHVFHLEKHGDKAEHTCVPFGVTSTMTSKGPLYEGQAVDSMGSPVVVSVFLQSNPCSHCPT